MGDWISKDGKLYPRKERVGLVNNSSESIEVNGVTVESGEPFIYEGANRSALIELEKKGVESLGEDFRYNQDIILLSREMGFKDVDAYAKVKGYDKKKVEEEFEKNASIVTKHELPKKVAAIKQLAGGQDQSNGGLDKYGAFGNPPTLA